MRHGTPIEPEDPPPGLRRRDPDGQAYASVRKGADYVGSATILNLPYLTMYHPVSGPDGRPVGLLFLGISQASILGMIAEGKGDLTLRLHPRTRDEIGDLSRNFNRFTEQMASMIGTLSSVVAESERQGEEMASGAEEVSATMEEMSATMGSLSSRTTTLFLEVKTVVSASQEIEGQSRRAARAGEHGGSRPPSRTSPPGSPGPPGWPARPRRPSGGWSRPSARCPRGSAGPPVRSRP